jgi:predicted HTH transcriptional regulator
VVSDAAAELLRKIRLGEDSFLELKEVFLAGGRIKGPGRDQLADELAAFANSTGGIVVLSVSDEPRAVTGIPIEHLDAVERYVSEIASDSITPPVVPLIEKQKLPDADGRMRPVLKVEIPRGFFVHQSPGGYLHRVGSSKRQMEPAVLARLFEQRSQSRGGQFDRQVVAEASVHDLDARLVDRFRGEISGDDRTTALSKLDMIRVDDAGVLRPTVAGVLLGTRQPQRWLPHAYIQAVAYRGASIGEALDSPRYQLDAKDNDGPLDDQIAYACRFVARNQRVEASKSMGRQDWPQYDLAAVFEAVVNAVAHRDYSIRGSKVRLRMFSDRIELCSPGALVNGMSIDELAYKQNTRNPAIANLLDRCPVPEEIESPRLTMMDRRGEGVPAILARSRRLSGRQPVYEMFGDELRLTIHAADAAAGSA